MSQEYFTGPVSGTAFITDQMYILVGKKCKLGDKEISPSRFYRCDTDIAQKILKANIPKTIIHADYLMQVTNDSNTDDMSRTIGTNIQASGDCILDDNIIFK